MYSLKKPLNYSNWNSNKLYQHHTAIRWFLQLPDSNKNKIIGDPSILEETNDLL